MVLFLNTTTMGDLRLKEILEEKNMTLTDLAEKTGIEKGNLSAISNNKKNPTMETLKKIADALGINLVELFSPIEKTRLIGIVKLDGIYRDLRTVEDVRKLLEDLEKDNS